ncbi:hypothetical protein BXY70_1352 [Roseovarius halotolerans]|uniref:Uncharacterized protein n=1 Tax=Roseovarius halotolerans TaxID=505353 RepID=A0A1X6Y539_9RHOB|nr:hypothetical protein [Roseovarius halotolerans]RKT35319.1 hypothetical protein BXY70_1352 [Roseovarius halotolerans]SLN10967.1 hypothetical protein ROH8110_00044 [Roseovarius halotolerans]
MTDEILDAEFEDLGAVRPVPDRPASTFKSTYGPSIYDNARRSLSDNSARYGWTRREKSSAWPGIFLTALARAAREPGAHEFKDSPNASLLEVQIRKARDFQRAFEAVSGRELRHPARQVGLNDAGRKEAIAEMGSVEMSAHRRAAHASDVSTALVSEARELHESGVCAYENAMMQFSGEFANGERDRENSQRVRVVRRSRDRGMCR